MNENSIADDEMDSEEDSLDHSHGIEKTDRETIIDDSSENEDIESDESEEDISDGIMESSLNAAENLNNSIGLAIRRSIHRFSRAVSREEVISSGDEEHTTSTQHIDIEESSDEDSNESSSSEEDASGRDQLNNPIEEAENPKMIRGSDEEIEIADIPKNSRKAPVIELNTSSDEGVSDADHSMERSLAISMAKEETLNTVIDPVMAQHRALLVYKQQRLESELAKQKRLYKNANLAVLPDNGEVLRLSIATIEKKLLDVTQKLKQQLQESRKLSPNLRDVKRAPLFKTDSQELNPTYLLPTTSDIKVDLGKKAQETRDREQSLTVERLKDMHGSLLNRPTEDQKAEDPRGLKIPLMPHQQHALAWLLWREEQKPPGGVLADDMGLGKTLTMISLVIASIAQRQSNGDSDEESEWKSSMRPEKHLGGTLVVAPASLLAQWEAEVKNRCRRGLLSVELFHGKNRENVPRRLAKTDIVITTYNILTREFKTSSVLYKIQWRRVILDEAHVVRNHKSLACEAVCGLNAKKRWALTGTPIHNKEMDLYSILKFLKCSPFDDVRVWKRWVDNKNAAGHERLATVMKTLMLRRTKAELQAKGELDSMPEKNIEVINVQLDPEERNVYDKVMVYSRTLFAQFLTQRAEKNHKFELGAGKYDKPSWETTYKKTQFTKAQEQLLAHHADVKSHEILVLLLRLRQVCCHPPLIHSMLDQEDIEGTEFEEAAGNDLLTQVKNLNLSSAIEDNEVDAGVDDEVKQHLLTSDNPVFNAERQCSKMRAVMAKVNEILEKGDKMIVVSQWVGVLDVIANELDSVNGINYRKFTGKVAVKDRQGILDDFNSSRSKVNVLLLSLTAGGVGLNLVGANHLLLIDIHWNPQLESQAQDRIYRFGQKKDVFIYKYICSDTIEERIQALQDKKLEIADTILSGSGKQGGSKLSLDDLKSLFSL